MKCFPSVVVVRCRFRMEAWSDVAARMAAHVQEGDRIQVCIGSMHWQHDATRSFGMCPCFLIFPAVLRKEGCVLCGRAYCNRVMPHLFVCTRLCARGSRTDRATPVYYSGLCSGSRLEVVPPRGRDHGKMLWAASGERRVGAGKVCSFPYGCNGRCWEGFRDGAVDGVLTSGGAVQCSTKHKAPERVRMSLVL